MRTACSPISTLAKNAWCLCPVHAPQNSTTCMHLIIRVPFKNLRGFPHQWFATVRSVRIIWCWYKNNNYQDNQICITLDFWFQGRKILQWCERYRNPKFGFKIKLLYGATDCVLRGLVSSFWIGLSLDCTFIVIAYISRIEMLVKFLMKIGRNQCR